MASTKFLDNFKNKLKINNIKGADKSNEDSVCTFLSLFSLKRIVVLVYIFLKNLVYAGYYRNTKYDT